MRLEMTRFDVRHALIDARDRMLLKTYELVDLTLARLSGFIPERVYRRLERRISRRQMELLALPSEWMAEGPDGFKPEDVIDIVFAHGAPNPDRVGCCSEAELIEFANRRRPVDDPGFKHIMNCSPCYRRFRTLQRLNRQ
jgi:hypothetical protein